jgi:hypothetical protein
VQQVVDRDHPGVADLVGVGVRREFRRTGRAAGVEDSGKVGARGCSTHEGVGWLLRREGGQVAEVYVADRV